MSILNWFRYKERWTQWLPCITVPCFLAAPTSMSLKKSVRHSEGSSCWSPSRSQAVNSKFCWVQSFFEKLLFKELVSMTVRILLEFCTRRNNGKALAWFPTVKNFSKTATAQGGILLWATKTHDPSRKWSFFPFSRKMATWDSSKCKLSTFKRCRSSQRRKPKNPWEDNEAN